VRARAHVQEEARAARAAAAGSAVSSPKAAAAAAELSTAAGTSAGVASVVPNEAARELSAAAGAAAAINVMPHEAVAVRSTPFPATPAPDFAAGYASQPRVRSLVAQMEATPSPSPGAASVPPPPPSDTASSLGPGAASSGPAVVVGSESPRTPEARVRPTNAAGIARPLPAEPYPSELGAAGGRHDGGERKAEVPHADMSTQTESRVDQPAVAPPALPAGARGGGLSAAPAQTGGEPHRRGPIGTVRAAASAIERRAAPAHVPKPRLSPESGPAAAAAAAARLQSPESGAARMRREV
jgi:hypothetical protein